MADFWVFGYGSLMWRPGFAFAEAVGARLHGAHRALCVYSIHHRGSAEAPGLVLGLDRGGSCRGIAFRIAGESAESVMAYLRERELVTNVYREARVPVRLEGSGAVVGAVAYLIDRGHSQYAGVLPREAMLEIVRRGAGRSGANRDYVIDTARHLAGLGIRDRTLEWLSGQLAGSAAT